jgi:hypothetical protein
MLERAMSDVMYIKPLDPYFDDKMHFIMDVRALPPGDVVYGTTHELTSPVLEPF